MRKPTALQTIKHPSCDFYFGKRHWMATIMCLVGNAETKGTCRPSSKLALRAQICDQNALGRMSERARTYMRCARIVTQHTCFVLEARDNILALRARKREQSTLGGMGERVTAYLRCARIVGQHTCLAREVRDNMLAMRAQTWAAHTWPNERRCVNIPALCANRETTYLCCARNKRQHTCSAHTRHTCTVRES